MPELPEVETIARGLAARVTGDVVESVWLGQKKEPLKSPASEIAGTLERSRIAAVRRMGKHIVFDLDYVGRTLLSAFARADREACGNTPSDFVGFCLVRLLLAGIACPERAKLVEGSARPTPLLSRSNTMCLPIRRTATMRLRSRVPAISEAGDFSGSFFWPSQTDSTTSPVTRAASPRTMVSTSGSSGMGGTDHDNHEGH